MNLSTASSTTLSTCFPTPKASVSAISGLVDGGAACRRSWKCSSFPIFCALRLRGTPETVDDRKSFSGSGVAVSAVGSLHQQDEIRTTFLELPTEQELLLGIKKEAEAGRLPLNVAKGMEELYYNYRNAVLESGHPEAHEIILSNMAVVFERIFMDVQDPFQFSPYHEAIRAPFDYYIFGQKYIRSLIDFSNSFLGNNSIFSEMEQKLKQGENVILISNHQTEADPAVIALLLESTNLFIAENLIYVAGDRVLTDCLCKPFSKGRNLLCVYSKKHMNDDPELIDMKRRANTKSLKELAMLFRIGSKIIWIAPSGGRDRPDPVTNEWIPAPFDASAVDNMRRLAENSGRERNREKRVISFHGVGLSAGPKVTYLNANTPSSDPEEAKMVFAQSLYSSVLEQYGVLKSAIHGKQGFKASTSAVELSQPWL